MRFRTNSIPIYKGIHLLYKDYSTLNYLNNFDAINIFNGTFFLFSTFLTVYLNN